MCKQDPKIHKTLNFHFKKFIGVLSYMSESSLPSAVTKQDHFLSKFFSKNSLISTDAYLVYIALINFLFHMIFANSYGYFRDELYYIVSGTQHLSLGYVDFPPFIAYVAALIYPFTQDSLFSIHFVSTLVESILVFLTGIMARELGGGSKAQIIAELSTFFSLGFLAVGSLFSPDTFDQLWWTLLTLVIILLIKYREMKFWILAGVIIGFGLLTKLTIVFFVVSLFISFLAFPSSRSYLRSKWIIVGGFIAFIFILPMLYWNAVNNWPMLHFYLEFRGDVSGGGPFSFLYTQIATLDFLVVPLCLIGLFFFLKSEEGKELRFFGLSFILLFIFMLVLNMKPYYFFPIYPVIFAGGSLLVEKSSLANIGKFKWFGSIPYLSVLLLVAIFLVPDVMPILSPTSMISIYGNSSDNTSSSETGPLPQNLGDRLGWQEMVNSLAQVYNALPANEKSQTCIFTGNYGEASAINFLGKGLSLPPTISGHNNYYIWGPGNCSGQVLLLIGVQIPENQSDYQNVTLLTTLKCQYCMNLENNVPIYLLTHPSDPNFSLKSFWPSLKHYD